MTWVDEDIRPTQTRKSRYIFMLITISNLFPRPDQPTRGLYNLYLFREMGKMLNLTSSNGYRNICLVPEWRIWKWSEIREWKAPGQLSSSQVAGLLSKCPKVASSSATQQPNNPTATCDSAATVYLPVFYLPLVGRSINWWFYCRALKKISGYLLSVNGGAHSGPGATPNNPELVTNNPAPLFYIPWLYPDGVAAARAMRGTGARLWLMALGSDTFHLRSPVRRRLILESCAQAEGIVCVAQVLADRLAAAGVPPEKLHVVPNGVDAILFRLRNKTELSVADGQLSVVGGEKVGGCLLPDSSVSTTNQEPIINNRYAAGVTILFVGNLVPVKGPDILLKAFSKLCEQKFAKDAKEEDGFSAGGGEEHSSLRSLRASVQNPDFLPSGNLTSRTLSLLIIGSGSMQAELERLATSLGIADRVQFLGRRPPEEVALWMNAADVLCLASRSEGMPNVVLEARASGLPVVATPAGAVPELMLDKAYFQVVKSCSPEDLAEGLRGMLGRDLRCRKSDPAIQTWEQMARRILQLVGE